MPKATGSTGDTTIDEIKAALQAPEETPVPVLFPDVTTRGEEAFGEIIAFVENLMENGHPLSEAATWKQAGLRGHGHLMQILSRHALQAARTHYETAQSKTGFEATPETLKQHPAFDYEAASAWLFKTNHKLFSDRTYAHLGGTYTAFYAGMQAAYCDLVAQSVRVADAMLRADEDDPKALDIIEHVWKTCFDRLGVQEINDRIAGLIGVTAGEIDGVEYRATQARLRTRLREAAQMRWRDRNGRAYSEAMVAAWEVIQNDNTVLQDESTFAGTNFTATQFEIEVERVIDLMIRHDLQKLDDKDMDIGEVYALIENLEHWRSLFGEVEEPDEILPECVGEDYWRAEILDEYGYRNFTHLMECLHGLYAGTRGNLALGSRQSEDADDVYDVLMEVRDHLQRGNIPFDRAEAFDKISLERDPFFAALDETAPAAIIRDWSFSYHPGLTVTDRLKLLENANDAHDRIYNTHHTDDLPASTRMMPLQEQKLRMRRAEEIFAISRVSFKDNGIYAVMQPAVQHLADLDKTLHSKDFQDRTGLTPARADKLHKLYDQADLASLWKAATSEDEDPLDRLTYAIEFETRLDKMDAADVFALLWDVEKGWEEYQSRLSMIALEAMNTAVARMGEAPHDTIGNAQFLEAVRKGVTIINPDAFEHPAVFKRLTKTNLADFLANESATKDRLEQLIAANDAGFKITVEDAGAQLAAIRDRPKGAQSWYALRDLRHAATVTGFSLANDDVLKAARMNCKDLAELACDNALYAARAHMDDAIAKKPTAISLQDITLHGYHDFVQARKWVGRSGAAVLTDPPYQALGLAGRADFVERMRESLFDYLLQMENAVLHEGVTRIGPVKYLHIMEEMRDGYQALGFENEHDDAGYVVPEITSNAISVTTVREALRKYGPTACLSILNADISLTAKYRGMRKLMDFGARMDVQFADNPTTKVIDQKFTDVVYERLSKVIETFGKKPDDMARGWRLARAIDDLRMLHTLDRLEWFDKLFQKLNYGNFNAFCEDMAIKRLDQIKRRCIQRLDALDADMMGLGDFNRDVVVDIGRMQEVIESPLIDHTRINTIMNHAGVTREWIETTHRTSGALALPMLADMIYDPTMRVEERYEALSDIFDLRERVGTRNRIVQRMEWNDLEAARTDMTTMMASSYILHDMLRGEIPTWSPTLLNAYRLLEDAGIAMGDANALQAIGLSEAEAAMYAPLDRLALPYKLILRLDKLELHMTGQIHHVVSGIYRYMAQQDIDITDPSVQRALSMRSYSEMHRMVIAPAIHMAQAISSNMKNTQDPERGRELGKMLQSFMRVTGLESRVDHHMLREYGVLDRVSVGKMLEGFGKMMKARRTKPGELSNNPV